MLVLSARQNEEIVLLYKEKVINIKFITIKGSQARIGFTADKDVEILRSKFFKPKEREKLNEGE